jgi:hypothetical protein
LEEPGSRQQCRRLNETVRSECSFDVTERIESRREWESQTARRFLHE